MCYAEDQSNKAATDMTDSPAVSKEETNLLPEDYNFNIESVAAEKVEDWKNLNFTDFLQSQLLCKAETMNLSNHPLNFLDENELTLWVGKQISKKLSFDSEVEIKKDLKNMN